MKPFKLLVCLLGCPVLFAMCRKAEPIDESTYDERLSGGGTTVFDATSKAYTHPIAALAGRDRRVHELGDAAFEQSFVAAPSPINSGLGPIFNNVSCISCHHNDGKGIPTAGSVNSSLLVRISGDGADEFGGPMPIGGYGNQLQDKALFGYQPEVKIAIEYQEIPVAYSDGTRVLLRKPEYSLQQLYAAITGNYHLSPRMAPAVVGLGLLENIPEATLHAWADELDRDGDGISGKLNYVYNPVTKRKEIGRFGLKANTPNVLVQVASAFHEDMGITSSVFPEESSKGQPQYPMHLKQSGFDLPDSTLQAVVYYIQTLAVPARRDVADVEVLRGQTLFAQMNCSGCHKPVAQTGIQLAIPVLSNQRIYPYTDLLLHDMGEDLADNYTDYLANGREWRTPPLWGIGLADKVNGIPYYMHDGRARTLEEAILWHGGEAQKSKEQFMQLSSTDRKAVIRFLRSL